jgi:UDP-N-acetyl-2-amino-2-deoxyglucuronate dehydrogenase
VSHVSGRSGHPLSAPMRVAVIGAGLGSAQHFRSLEELAPVAELAWVCARDAQRLAAMPLPGSPKRTTRLQDIVRDDSVSAVLVLTPPDTHLAIVRPLAEAGKHVLVEKPLEISLAGARELVAVCEDNGVRLAVMLQHRMREASRVLASLVGKGELGQLISARAAVRWWRPQSYYDLPGRGTLARDGGGVLMTQAIHTLDLLLSLTGMPASVSGLTFTSPVHRMQCEDTAAALLHYASGAVATVEATTAAWPGFPETVELNGTLASATLQGCALRLDFADGRTLQAGQAESSGAGADIMGFDHGPHRAVIGDFLTAIRTATEPAVSGRSALRVHEVIDAIMASSGSGKPVRIRSD